MTRRRKYQDWGLPKVVENPDHRGRRGKKGPGVLAVPKDDNG